MPLTNINLKGWFFCLVVLTMFFASCNSTKFLGPNQSLLKSNEVEIVDEDNIEDVKKIKSNIIKLIPNQPNTNFVFFFPREYIYYNNSEPGDSSWYNKFFRTSIGEPPSLYDEDETIETARSIQNYLVNKKGFFHAKVDYDAITEDKYTEVIYRVDPKDRYKINSIEYYSEEKDILDILYEIAPESEIEKGDYIDAAQFDLELTRISLELQNRGYANFATNFISIKGDSTDLNNAVDIFLDIIPPLPDSTHTRFTIGDINVYTDFHRNQDITKLDTLSYDDKLFHKQERQFLVRPSSLSNLIFFETGQTYSRSDRSKTRSKLSSLGTYRFVTMNARLDEEIDTIIHYDILLTPHRNKWVSDYGSELFFSTINATSSARTNPRVFGFALSSQFKNRNFLGGAEQFTIGTETGVDLQINPTAMLRTVNFGVNTALEIPKQSDFFGMNRFSRWSGLFSENRYQSFKENTTTTINAGFNFVNIIDSYRRSSLNAGYIYDYRPNSNTRYLIRQLGLDYNNYVLKDTFVARIDSNQLLLRSFEDNLLTGFFFRDITYVYNHPINAKGQSYTFITSLEISGLETFLANKAYNAISGNDNVWKLANNIGFSKYIRFEIDPRWYKYFNSKQSFVARAYFGAIIPFGDSEVNPYSKQFSVGGPNSLRGWDQKELGPGAYSELIFNPQFNQTFYQTGDIKMEVNLEYRFDMVWVVEGALFVDVGNVWTLKSNERPGSKFTGEFYDQLAVAAGYGLRFDFTYFNIRFDFGYKLRNPFNFPNTNRKWYTLDEVAEQKFGNFQVAVNYPF